MDASTLHVNPDLRSHIKQALVNIGYPAEDLAGYVEGEVLAIDERIVKHRKGQIIIIEMYLEQLERVWKRYGFPIITGKTGIKKRRELHQ